ncbi:hypothetical protein FH972_004646 [Carpinus fangiana]|uniref:Mce/MlaD domain-containing protein n=1 Tax=Carpinus fangiana TaxID=176857 RepID=A0A5N6QLS4_9ROSI|nr:hypothetical protein FH972_004646 [Carpinus fangiana]
MVGNPIAQVFSSSLVTFPRPSPNCLPPFPSKSRRKPARIRAASADAETKNNIWSQTLRPLRDFGFGRRSIWEGGVGLFLVSGTVLLAVGLSRLRGFHMRSKFRKYLAVFEFAQACGICRGTPVRIRGVTVGNVIRITPSLTGIEAVVEVEDDKMIIPRNSVIEVNQSGLLMETLIDITPVDPIPTPSVGPLEPECVEEGVIVCDGQKMKGNQGVSLDAMVAIFTSLGREVEGIGVAQAFSLAQRVSSVIEEAKPLLAKIKALAEDVQPLLAEAHDGGVLREVEKLTRSLTEASEELR